MKMIDILTKNYFGKSNHLKKRLELDIIRFLRKVEDFMRKRTLIKNLLYAIDGDMIIPMNAEFRSTDEFLVRKPGHSIIV